MSIATLEPASETTIFLSEVQVGLRKPQKELPCKYFYDRRGSQLFDQICDLPEYYPTRTELSILRQYVGEMVDRLGKECCLIEYGSGSSLKSRLLLDALEPPATYIPIDISREHLHATARDLRSAYPELLIAPVCADYTAEFDLPRVAFETGRRSVYFPGSTIGNFHPGDAKQFLERVARVCHNDAGLLIGVDLRKDVGTLESAYNDAAGVTADFNLNLLHRINNELGAEFDVDRFAHKSIYNEAVGRIEMHLVSLDEQCAVVGGERFFFDAGETIWTESSYKYSLEGFEELAESAGFAVRDVWTDSEAKFSVQYLTVR